jgi:hypothetical protein
MLTLPCDSAPDLGKVGATIFPMDTSLVKGKKTRNITLLFVTYLAALSVG